MSSTYPGVIDTLNISLTDGIDAGDDAPGSVAVGTHAQLHIDANDAINNIEAELGVNPSGAASTVKARLDTLDVSQSVAYASSITPNVDAGGTVVVGALTGNMTVNAPTNAVGGKRLRFIFTQDSTGGRTITWNAVFKTPTWNPALGAAKVNTIEFVYDGTSWQQVSAAGISRQWLYNVLDYGAVGNNSTDDLAAIQAAVQAVPLTTGNTAGTGGVVFFPPGYIFKTTGTIDCDGRDGLTLLGHGGKFAGSAIFCNMTGTGSVISARSSRGFRLEGLMVLSTGGGSFTGRLLDLDSVYHCSAADGGITSGGTTLTSATAAFTAADVGKHIEVPGAGAASATLYTHISAYTNATTVTVADAAGTTVTTAHLTIYDRSCGDANITSGAAVLTSATAAFTAKDIGKPITVRGAGTAGGVLSTTIASYQSTTQVTLTANASTTTTTGKAAITPHNTTNFHVANAVMYGWTSSSIGISLNNAQVGTIDATYFNGGDIGIKGSRTAGDFSNAINVTGQCLFVLLDTTPILNPTSYYGQAGWKIDGNTFEPLSSGNAGAVTVTSGLSAGGLWFTNNWCGDANSSGTWLVVNGEGIVIDDNTIHAGAVGVQLNGTTTGLSVNGNQFLLTTTAIDRNSQTCTNANIGAGNSYTGVTTRISGETGFTTSLIVGASGVVRLGGQLVLANGLTLTVGPNPSLVAHQTAANYSYTNKLLAADAELAYGVLGDGTIKRGPGGSTAPTIIHGQGPGSPEGVVTGGIGSTWQRTDGSIYTSLYQKVYGTGNTGWIAMGPPGPEALRMQAYGFKAWNFPIEEGLTLGSAVAAGVLHWDRIEIPAPMTVSNITFYHILMGVTVADAYLAIYDSTGARVAVTADIAATLNAAAGVKTVALTGSVALSAGFYFVAYVFGSAGTAPQFGRTQGVDLNVGNMIGDARMCADYSSGLSAAPSNVTLASLANSTRNTWWALS